MKEKVTTANLPEVPFSIYFLKDGIVFPKRIFTVSRKCADQGSLYILELGRDIDYDGSSIEVVQYTCPN